MSKLFEPGRGLHSERGFSLIEVMFAAVYLAVGLLGIAAMQDIALTRNVDAKRISVATNLAVEMLERIRFNAPNNSKSYTGFGYAYNGIRVCNYACSGGSTAGNALVAVDATAAGDYSQWLSRISQTDTTGGMALPSAQGTVTAVSTGTSALGQVLVTVTISWTSGLRTPTISLSTIVAPL